jgi:hypothetical protein
MRNRWNRLSQLSFSSEEVSMLRASIAAVLFGIMTSSAIAQNQSKPEADPFGAPPQVVRAPAQGRNAAAPAPAAPDANARKAIAAKEARPEVSETRLTPEQRIYQALGDRTHLEFVETPLKEAMQYIADKHQIDVQYDIVALRDAAIDPTAIPVSLNVHGISLRSALNLILGQQNLATLVENEVLQITTKDKCNATLTMRMYDVRDLADAENINQLIDILSSTPSGKYEVGAIKPLKSNGTYSIYVSKPASVHEEIEVLLTELRRVKSQK